MSSLAAALIVAGVIAAGLLLLALGLCRAAGRPSPVKETRGQRVWDEAAEQWIRLPYGVLPGPGQLTEVEVRALDRFQVALNDLTTSPEWAVGRERLFDAVRDHRTNTPEGEA